MGQQSMVLIGLVWGPGLGPNYRNGADMVINTSMNDVQYKHSHHHCMGLTVHGVVSSHSASL